VCWWQPPGRRRPKRTRPEGPAVRRPGRKAGRGFREESAKVTQSECRAFGPRIRGLAVPALTGGAIHCRAFGPVNRTAICCACKCPNSRPEGPAVRRPGRKAGRGVMNNEKSAEGAAHGSFNRRYSASRNRLRVARATRGVPVENLAAYDVHPDCGCNQ
jgi:hypothetical protein